MEFNDFLLLLRRKTQTIFTLILVGTMMVILVSLLNPLKYDVSSRLLVTQDSATNDVYSLSRSNEYLGNLLAEVVYSGSFYDKVLNSSYKVDKNYFSGDYGKQIERWRKTISTKTKQDTGIIEINIYHTSVIEAKKIALAVNDILINNNKAYHGGENIKINVIDQPLASDYPVKPNLINNGIIALAIFSLFSLFFIYIFPEEKYSLYLFGKSGSSNKTKKSKQEKEVHKVIINGKKEKLEDNKSDNDDIDLSGNISNLVR